VSQIVVVEKNTQKEGYYGKEQNHRYLKLAGGDIMEDKGQEK